MLKIQFAFGEKAFEKTRISRCIPKTSRLSPIYKKQTVIRYKSDNRKSFNFAEGY